MHPHHSLEIHVCRGQVPELLSLPEHGILTTDRYSHYQSNEFSLRSAILTTRAMDSHYRSLFSLPDQ